VEGWEGCWDNTQGTPGWFFPDVVHRVVAERELQIVTIIPHDKEFLVKASMCCRELFIIRSVPFVKEVLGWRGGGVHFGFHGRQRFPA
jgi:hypothetical protein